MFKKMGNINMKKIIATTACAAFIIGLGSSSLISPKVANATTDNTCVKFINKIFTGSRYADLNKLLEKSQKLQDGIVVIADENGEFKYSEDGGKTFTDKLPEGIEIDFFKGPNLGNDLIIKVNENGETTYSEDGGKTFIEGIPKGIELNPIR